MDTASKVPVWFERKFEFSFPVEQHPNLCVRLRGTSARLEEILRGVSRNGLVDKPRAKWSVQEHAGKGTSNDRLFPRGVYSTLRKIRQHNA